MGEYLNFGEISKTPFSVVLDHLNQPYTEMESQIKGEGFIINTQKNLYFNPTGDDKGSVINFVSNRLGIDLREAASWVKNLNGKPREQKALPEYELFYHPFLEQSGISKQIAEDFEMGYCKKGIMSGKIAIKIKDENGDKVAYIGRNINNDKSDYYFPKRYKSEHIYNLWRVKSARLILAVSPLDVARISSFGYDNVAGLITSNMTAEQENLLKRYSRIFFLHPQPENIVRRLSKWAFVKAPEIDKVSGLTKEDIDVLY